ncbi:hypothetical protein H9649_07460 [Sporosarcina sp. Sa2YVA2]|uniref:Phage head-tail adapter protein n=1 Tax=Sporosarcina quadrami TaxID=2762234 RepID=A0ABR8U8Q5_9BACL|nr:hypothetical protein [Sporosarcina quadrami]MBD7984411.1 hypothetical protein [Sporosarcina quadrami]
MNWSDVVQLVDLVEGTDKDGFPEVVPGRPRKVFANRKSVRSQEFHAAKQQGITLSYMFEVRTDEYQGEESLFYNGLEQNVYRTYEKGEFIELICHRKGDDHET